MGGEARKPIAFAGVAFGAAVVAALAFGAGAADEAEAPAPATGAEEEEAEALGPVDPAVATAAAAL